MTLGLGTIHTMRIGKKVNDGYLLTKGAMQTVLPFEHTEEELTEGNNVDVFLYKDRNEKIVASTMIPKVVIGVYDWAEVVDVFPNLGVFVNIGTTVEVLVPKDDLPTFQKVWPLPGDKLYVTLSLDKQERLLGRVAKETIFTDMIRFGTDIDLNNQVDGRIIRVDREGAVIFTEQQYRGFIHHSEREREPRLGEFVSGRVIEVKEDGTINVSLLPLKHERMDDDAEKIMKYLEDADGVMPFGDKSDPDSIRSTFQMSKSAFKRALGRLMKQGKIEQRDGKTFSKE